MAIDKAKLPNDIDVNRRAIDIPTARIAGALAVGGALLLIIGAMIAVTTGRAVTGPQVTLWFVLVGVAVLAAATGIQLVRGAAWAQRTVLVFWLAAGGMAFLRLLHGLLIGPMPDTLGVLLWIVVLVLSIIAAGITARASTAGTRGRYGSMVLVTAAAAIVVVLALNFIAQTDYWRADIETLGRFGLSQRTRRIIEDIDQPVRITAVYTADQRDEQYLPRVRETLNEIVEAAPRREGKPLVSADVAESEGEKLRLVQRLRDQVARKAGGHQAFLERFADSQDLTDAMAAEVSRWNAWPEDSFLGLWGLGVHFATITGDQARQFRAAREEVTTQLTSPGMPDYAGLIDQTTETLRGIQQNLTTYQGLLAGIAEIPEQVRANRADANETLRQLRQAAGGALAAIGEPNAPLPENPAERLEQIAEQVRATVTAAQRAAETLSTIGGARNARIVAQVPAWQYRRVPLQFYVQRAAEDFRQFLNEALSQTELLTAEGQKDLIQRIRDSAYPQMLADLVELPAAAREAMDRLTAVDNLSAGVLEQARQGELFAAVLGPIGELLNQADQLGDVPADDLAETLSQQNIIVVEVGGKIEVVTFDEVWPLRIANPAPGADPIDAGRTYNADAAIGSRLLRLTRQPFGTVYLAHVPPPQIPPQMQMFQRPSPPAPTMYTELRRRIEQANFAVEEWSLAGPIPPALDPNAPEADAADQAARVVMVLPAPMMAQWEPDQVGKLRSVVDAGTPAVFLTSPSRDPMGRMAPTMNALNQYLLNQWGLDVLADYLVVPAVPADDEPGRARLNLLRFQYLPLNTFTDHPIGEPLQGQRVLLDGGGLCPILAADANAMPEGVSLSPILVVPDNWSHTWATSNVDELVMQFQRPGSYIAPGPEDLRPPFPVAQAAMRTGGEDGPLSPGRVVVLGLASSLRDMYLTAQSPRMDPDGGTQLADPPRTNADVVLNSVYWLAGVERYIAAGPARVKPVEMIGPATRGWLWALCVVVLPLATVIAGAAVMVARRR